MIGIPDLDSILVGFSADTVVTGLDQIPDDEEPPAPTLLHLAFDAMVGIGKCPPPAQRHLRAGSGGESGAGSRSPSGSGEPRAWPAWGSIIALESGWIVTEVGRQPWVVHGLLRTEDAVTQAGRALALAGTLVVQLPRRSERAAIWALRAMSRRWAREEGGEDETGLAVWGPPAPTGGGDDAVTELTIVIVVLWGGGSSSTRSSAARTSGRACGISWPGAPSAVRSRVPSSTVS